MTDALLEGIVERIDVNLSRVRSGENLFDCDIRMKLFRYGPLKTDIAVGDVVRFKKLGEDKGVIEEILPRRTKLNRRAIMKAEGEQLIAANIDQIVSVSSTKHPSLRLNLIDRYLVLAEKNGFDAMICINKTDLADEEEIAMKVQDYRKMGYPVVLVSAVTGQNVEQLKSLLINRISILAGHSGVGKSSLINLLVPDANMPTREISIKWKRGTHMTTAVSMLKLPEGGYIMDTPGIREFGLFGVTREELPGLFRDFVPHLEKCRFNNCVHINEPVCGVRDAVEKGEISERRYNSYLSLYDSTSSGNPWKD